MSYKNWISFIKSIEPSDDMLLPQNRDLLAYEYDEIYKMFAELDAMSEKYCNSDHVNEARKKEKELDSLTKELILA
jgi:hypothetical protein